MKISLYSITLNGGYYNGPHVPVLEMLLKMKEWGYDGLELEDKRPHGSPLDLDAAARDRIRKTAEDNGIEMSAIAHYNDYATPIDEHREHELIATREAIRLAADLGAPVIRVFACWSGVTRRNGRITYDIARRNLEDRWPGTTGLEKWCHVRDCLTEAAKMAEDAGVVLALQNHTPIIYGFQDMLDFIHEVNSPALKACFDSPHTPEGVDPEEYYSAAFRAVGDLMVHSHFGGRYERQEDGSITRPGARGKQAMDRQRLFVKLAKEVAGYGGHLGYELCSPVLTGHVHEGLDHALLQAELACEWMRGVIASVE